MKRLILSFLVVSVLLLAACTAPTVTQTVTVTSTATLETTPIVTVTATTTSTITVTSTSTQTVTTTPPTTTPPTFDITGTWSGNWWRSDGKEEGTLIASLILSGNTLTGDMTFTSTTFEYSEDTTILGTVEGSDVVFGMAISSNGETVTIDYEGTISEDGNQMSGTYYISTGWTGTWSVTRE
jgi:hypothetical protein